VTGVCPSRRTGSPEAAHAHAVFGVAFGTAVALVGRRLGGSDATALFGLERDFGFWLLFQLPYLADVLASGLESIYPV
jgi:hypothetical protein